ncbi:MAG: T9SS type A sorting domain-containing protein, partial [Ignavibacterium sp.]|nr:T9SS type A sorting domain-containing protein [Ignavibacterium sp.]
MGRKRLGQILDPCAYDQDGSVYGGVDCSLINPNYWYSGDPITNVGWLNTQGTDQRMFVNSGPFNLEVGKPITIIYAYIIGRGTDRLNSFVLAREIAAFTHQFYQSNFDDNLVSVEEEMANITTEFILHQNYPNPFNPSTKISWQSPVSSHQILKVYDVLGNEVAALVNEEKPAGNYSVEFNASQLASGIYLYKLQAGSFI